MCRTGFSGYVTLLATLGLLFALPAGGVQADEARPQDTEPTFDVNVHIALSSLMSLGDGHLQKMADSLHFLAASDAARSAEWDRIREPYHDADDYLKLPSIGSSWQWSALSGQSPATDEYPL